MLLLQEGCGGVLLWGESGFVGGWREGLWGRAVNFCAGTRFGCWVDRSAGGRVGLVGAGA